MIVATHSYHLNIMIVVKVLTDKVGWMKEVKRLMMVARVTTTSVATMASAVTTARVMVASLEMLLESFDIKNAYLTGEDMVRRVFLRAPSDMFGFLEYCK